LVRPIRHGLELLRATKAPRRVRHVGKHPERTDARPAGLAGIEVPLDGLPRPGVVRVALPNDGHICCT
jgi:hypothetical protein